jgi:hypothetical protein
LGDIAKSDTAIMWELGAWLSAGEKYAKRYTDSKLKLGDHLIMGEPHCETGGGESIAGYWIPVHNVYTFAERRTGLARQTLIDLASTARRCHKGVRRDGLSWSHHRVLVNARPEADEDELRNELKMAEDEKLSVNEFRKKLKRFKPANKAKTFLVPVPIDVWEALKDLAANEKHRSVQRYTSNLITRFARSEDGVMQRDFAKANVAERRYKQRQRVGRRVARMYDSLGVNRDST